MINLIFNHIQQNLLPLTKVLNLYTYGSRVYGNFRKDSDYDFIAVVDNNSFEAFETQLTFFLGDKEVNVNVYNLTSFENRIDDHCIDALECLFLSKDLKIENLKISYKIDLEKLRISISTICSNSYVKAKKKLIVPEDYNEIVAKKSLWHVFRIYNFGIQICLFGKILDFSPKKELELFETILNFSNSWKEIQKEFQPLRNYYATEFKKLTSKL